MWWLIPDDTLHFSHNSSTARPYRAALRQVGSRSGSMTSPFHHRRSSPNFGGQSLLTIAIGRRCLRIQRKHGERKGWFQGCWRRREQLYGPVGWFTSSGTFSAYVWQWKLGGNRGNAEYTGGVSPSVIQTDHRDDSETFGGRGLGVSPGSGGTRSCRITPHIGVHFEMTGNHSGTGGMPQHLWTRTGKERSLETNQMMRRWDQGVVNEYEK